MSTNPIELVEEVEFLDAERKHFRAVGPHFVIAYQRIQKIHDDPFWVSVDQVLSVILVHRAKEYAIHLSPCALAVFGLLARRRIPQNARAIADAMKNMDRSLGRTKRLVSWQPRCIKVFIQRIRRKMQSAFDRAGLRLDSSLIVASESTDDSRQVLYRIKATFDFLAETEHVHGLTDSE